MGAYEPEGPGKADPATLGRPEKGGLAICSCEVEEVETGSPSAGSPESAPATLFPWCPLRPFSTEVDGDGGDGAKEGPRKQPAEKETSFYSHIRTVGERRTGFP